MPQGPKHQLRQRGSGEGGGAGKGLALNIPWSVPRCNNPPGTRATTQARKEAQACPLPRKQWFCFSFFLLSRYFPRLPLFFSWSFSVSVSVAHMHIHTYKYTYIHTHIQIPVHTHTSIPLIILVYSPPSSLESSLPPSPLSDLVHTFKAGEQSTAPFARSRRRAKKKTSRNRQFGRETYINPASSFRRFLRGAKGDDNV